MTIGFTHRVQRVSESLVASGEDLVTVTIAVSVSRRAQRDHPMVFRYEESTSTAVVEPANDVADISFDALFGTRFSPGDPIQEFFDLQSEQDAIPPLIVSIRNDLLPEDEECLTIRIFPVDVPGRSQLFSCSEDSVGATNFFCKHTLCITDDDGKCFSIDFP